ncbi:MAG: PqqD family protein [Clostridiales bacterium]|nr:PqqD family protein [Clostridiales bacterium]
MFKLKKTVVVRKIGDDYILVPVGKSSKDYKGVFSLTPVAALIIDMLNIGAQKEELVNSVTNEFDIDETTALKDVEIFLERLSEIDLI